LAPSNAEVLARENSWRSRAGFAAIFGAILALAGFVLLRSALSGDANFEGLEEAHAHSSTVWIAVLLILLVLITLAGLDYLAIRRYGKRHYQVIQSQRRAMIHDELRRYRREQSERN
jgi:protein-S-isoprenylcysteine O-methyltransferase Ste14